MIDPKSLTDLQNDLDATQILINEARAHLERHIANLTPELWREYDAALRARQAVLDETQAKIATMLI